MNINVMVGIKKPLEIPSPKNKNRVVRIKKIFYPIPYYIGKNPSLTKEYLKKLERDGKVYLVNGVYTAQIPRGGRGTGFSAPLWTERFIF